jgi:hypothetical protein
MRHRMRARKDFIFLLHRNGGIRGRASLSMGTPRIRRCDAGGMTA